MSRIRRGDDQAKCDRLKSRKVIRAMVMAFGLGICSLPALGQTTTRVSADDARILARDALNDGNPALAATIAEALLAQQPSDYQMQVLLALASSQLGDHSKANAAARQAFRIAKTDSQKLEAARLAANTRFRAGQFSRAELWLRRASNFADSPDRKRAVVADFQAVRKENPLTTRLSFSLSPSSNINGGSSEEILYIGDFAFYLSPDSLALSGFEFSADVNLNYRISQSKAQISDVGLRMFGRTYALSTEAAASVPGITGSDYALVGAELSFNHRRQVFENLGASGISVLAGQNWYGGDPLWRYYRLSLSQDFPINADSAVTLRGFVEQETALTDSNSDTNLYDLDATYGRRLGNSDVMRISLGGRLADAKADDSDYKSLRGTLSYSFDQPIFDTRLSLSLGLASKDYNSFSLSLDGRRDRSVSLGATAVFDRISYLGFSPSLTVSATSTQSNVSRYSTDQLSARFAIQSNF